MLCFQMVVIMESDIAVVLSYMREACPGENISKKIKNF
jgi:hypothetical protein